MHPLAKHLLIFLLLLAALCSSRASAGECAATVGLERIQSLLKQAEKSIYLVQFDGAVTALDETEALIPCLGEVVSRDVLTRLFLFRGVVAFNQGNEVGATTAFRRAMAIDPELGWNERFGQKALGLFQDSRAAVQGAPLGRVRLPRAAEGVVLFVDSGPQPVAGGEIELLAGRHLIQAFKGSDLVTGVWVEVPGGGLVIPPLPPEAGTMVQPQVISPVGPDQPAASRAWMRPAGLGAMGGGGALLGVSAVTGALYLQSRAALEGGEYYSNRDDPEKEALLARNRGAAIVTDIALPVGAVAAGAGAVLFLLSRRQEDPRLGAVVPFVAPGGGGITLSLRF